MSQASLADPVRRDDPQYVEDESRLPKVIRDLTEDQKAELFYMVQKKAWIYATEIEDFTEEEKKKVAKIERKKGPKVAKAARDRLYLKYHWRALRWFLFGGLVDIPVQENPKKAWDPVSNPFIKIRVRSFCWTIDEHDQSEPRKRLPDKDYLRLMAYAWVHEPLLAIPKSRQMMVTWLFCAIAAHETLFRESKNTAWISKKFDDANATIEKRVKPLIKALPDGAPGLHVPDYTFKAGELASGTSIIRAMGEEARGLRQYTFSWVFDDEAAFQVQASDNIQAALPAVKGGGRLTLVSSANGKETFYGVVSENGRISVPAGH